MRKIEIYLLVTCLFFVMTGCMKNNYEEEKTSDSQQAVEEKNVDSDIAEKNDVIESIPFPNPYFYNQNHIILKAEYYEEWGNLTNETVDMQISFVKSYEQGNVYKFTIDVVPDFQSYFSGENMNIYFYVTEDKIYRLRPYVQPQPNGETYYFYDDDELLIQMLDTDEKMMNNGEVVCQEEEIEKEYSSIKVNGDQITYSLHEIKPNGEDGYQEIFVWEKGKGLIEYRVGFGSQPYAVYLGEISEVMELKWEWIIRPEKYTECILIGEELVAVKKENGRYGIIGRNGEYAFLDEYDEISRYTQGVAAVQRNRKYSYIDNHGTRVIEGDFEDARTFCESKAAVKINGLWGFINLEGIWLLIFNMMKSEIFKKV